MASHCEICGSEYGFNPRGYMECDRCGDFNPDLGYSIANPDIQIRLSGWIRDQNRLGDQPTITPDVISRVGKMAIPGLRRRADNLLREIAKLLPGYTGIIRPNSVYDSPASQAITYSRNSEEVVVVINLLQHLDYIAIDGNRLRLTPNGILAIEEMAATGSEYAQVFVAMSFSPDLNESWEEGFKPAINNAGWRPIRIDATEFTGIVVDQIMAEIRRSRFIIADWTNHRNGVYYEAGFATGLGLLVIPTCQKDDMKNMHFDTAHLNTLEWESPNELREKLERRIRAVIGAGPDVIE